MTNKPLETSLSDRLWQAVKRFLHVDHEERLWARRGEVLMVLTTISLISTVSYLLFIMAPSVIIRQAFDAQTNLFWLYCMIFILGQISVMWIAKQRMVKEGALLLIFMSAGVLIAMSVVGGLEVWALSLNMGLMIMIVMAGGMLGRNAALIASVLITALEATLIALHQPAVSYDLLVDSAWYNFSLAGLLWGTLRPLEQLADEAEQTAKAPVMEHDQETKRRVHSELVKHLQQHSKNSFAMLKVHMKTLSDDPALSHDSQQALEEVRMHINRVQHASDEMLDYVMLTQPDMPAPVIEEYGPPQLIMGLQMHFKKLGVEVDLHTNGLPRTVLGMPAATRRALIHLGEYALRITGSNDMWLSARIEGQKGWRIGIESRFATPPDAITVMASDTLRAMGGEVHIETTPEELIISVLLPFKMLPPHRRHHH